jgi:hypothetical protein
VSRALLVLTSKAIRERAIDWIRRTPAGTRVEFKAPQRSLEQNSKLWACLSDIAVQKTHAGRKYTTEQWKILFMHACGREVQFMPALDSSTFIPYGHSSSDLSKDEFSELLEFMLAWGAENGVIWSDPQSAEQPQKENAA